MNINNLLVLPFVIYADLECLTEKLDGCKNNPEKSSTTKVGQHIPSGISLSTISSFKSIENKHDAYRSKDCMEKFCEFIASSLSNLVNNLSEGIHRLKFQYRHDDKKWEAC